MNHPNACAVCGKPMSDTDTLTRRQDGTLAHYWCNLNEVHQGPQPNHD